MGFLEKFIDWIIENGGLYVLLLVVFAETGLLVGFLFPGDSLLFHCIRSSSLYFYCC